jgi:hypothetical protein
MNVKGLKRVNAAVAKAEHKKQVEAAAKNQPLSTEVESLNKHVKGHVKGEKKHRHGGAKVYQ